MNLSFGRLFVNGVTKHIVGGLDLTAVPDMEGHQNPERAILPRLFQVLRA